MVSRDRQRWTGSSLYRSLWERRLNLQSQHEGESLRMWSFDCCCPPSPGIWIRFAKRNLRLWGSRLKQLIKAFAAKCNDVLVITRQVQFLTSKMLRNISLFWRIYIEVHQYLRRLKPVSILANKLYYNYLELTQLRIASVSQNGNFMVPFSKTNNCLTRCTHWPNLYWRRIIRQRRIIRLRRMIRLSINSVRRRIMDQNSSEADSSVSTSSRRANRRINRLRRMIRL